MEIMELARRENALFVQSCPDWDEREVWQLLFYDPADGPQEIGIPCLASVKNGNAQLMSDEEIEAYMKDISDDSGDPFDGEILKVA